MPILGRKNDYVPIKNKNEFWPEDQKKMCRKYGKGRDRGRMNLQDYKRWWTEGKK